MVEVPVDVIGPSANPNFVRVRIVNPDNSWREVLVVAGLVREGKVMAHWIAENDTQILVELPAAGPDVRMWVTK